MRLTDEVLTWRSSRISPIRAERAAFNLSVSMMVGRLRNNMLVPSWLIHSRFSLAAFYSTNIFNNMTTECRTVVT